MPSSLRHVTVDCRDAEAVGRFWEQALGWGADPEVPNEPGDDYWTLVPPDGQGPGLLFQPVASPSPGKNNLHFDIQPDIPRDDEVQRLVGLGATVVADRRNDDGSGWVTMADVEGNEFCVERSAAERDD